ncbi:hypothetical protein CIB48_g4161 [Xylaria polymorpha]|nr:hypothetical protein CIB48_g4161 [Xylaria polymorpha]
MPKSIRIVDAKGRFIAVSADASQEKIMLKARNFLITCDIMNSQTPTFGGQEFSDNAAAEIEAVRANCSVKLSFENGVYLASWQW